MSAAIQYRIALSSALAPFQQRIANVNVPGPVKWLVLLVVLLNIKSWPFVWHLRVFRPVIRVWLRDVFTALRVRLSLSKAQKQDLEETWIDNVTLVGKSPFDFKNIYRTRATLDECDFNNHLSNSSYAKVLDATRFECLVRLFPVFFRSGGAMALGASNFHFIREISIGQSFEIRSTIGGWDNKWLYLVSKFVSPPKRSSKSAPKNTIVKNTILTEPDGAIIYCVAVVHLCFKAGRITVPPALVLASNGFSIAPPQAPPPPSPDDTLTSPSPSTLSTTASPYSSTNPPPHWSTVKALASPKHGGSLSRYFAFVRAGWKEVDEGERWWEVALGGAVEEQRAAAMRELAGLQKGMEAARGM